MHKNEYYKTLLSSWFNLITTKPDRFKDFLAEDVFANPLFTTDNQTFDKEYNNWKEASILKVSDIFQDWEKLVLNKEALERKFNLSINDMKFNRLINCVSEKTKESPTASHYPKILILIYLLILPKLNL